LEKALQQGLIAGAGLDTTYPEKPSVGNLMIISHQYGPGGQDRQWRLFRENIRRFVAGEALLGVVDKGKGF
jgi:phosphoglycerate dehydrogenase-like enzyme